MKKVIKTLVYLFLVCFFSQALAQTDKNAMLTVNGKIRGIDSGKIYMYSPDRQIPDSAMIVKGQFKMTAKFGEIGRRSFLIQPGEWQFMGYADVLQIGLDIDTTDAIHQYAGGKDHPMIARVKETGSPLGDAYDAFLKETGQYEYLDLTAKLRVADKDSAAAINSKIEAITSAFPEASKIWIDKYVRQDPGSVAAIYLFNELFHQSRDKSAAYLRTMIAKFSGAAKETIYFKKLNDELAKLESMQIGKPAPDFTLQKRDKSKLTLSSMRGSVVLLDFWASWCGPCRAGIPAWKKVYAKYHAKGFNIIGISDDRKWADWTKALDQEKMPWTQVIDKFPAENSPAMVGQLYGGHPMPYYVLIGKTGEILASGEDTVITKKLAEIFE